MLSRPKFFALLALSSLNYEAALARHIFLNGVDISGASSQEMKAVDVHINEEGNVFITAPHYEVHEEDYYLPLSSYLKKDGKLPTHKPPAPLPEGRLPASPASEERSPRPSEAAKPTATLMGSDRSPLASSTEAPPLPGLPAPGARQGEASSQLEKAGSKTPTLAPAP